MKASEWKSHWIRGGKAEHVTWVGRDVMAWCSGLHIVFYDVVHKTQVLKKYADHAEGEGACCLSGHPSLLLFAFAEKVSNPRVLVYTYPAMTRVSECLQGAPSGYLATAFTEHEHLVTLASYPHFALVIWSWRTGERLTTVRTHIRDLNEQMIATTYSGPTMIVQLGKETGKLTVWQMRMCGKMVSLKFEDVELPRGERVNAATWCPDPGPPILAILDQGCHMYVLPHDATLPIKIAQTQRCSECMEIEASDICWHRGGLVLKTTFCQIRYYKKLSDKTHHWSRIWMVKVRAHPYILTSHPFRADRLFFHTLEGDLTQIEVSGDSDLSTEPVLISHRSRGAIYRFMNWIYPWGNHLTVVDNSTELSILETQTGVEISRINLGMSGSISRVTSRRDIPLIASTSSTGHFALVGICDPKQPLILVKYHLYHYDLDILKFSYSGNYVAAGFSLAGTCFCISSKVGSQFEVIGKLETNRQISDVLLYDNLGHLRLFVLCVTSKRAVVGDQILLYDLANGQTRFSAASYVLELLDSFKNLRYSPIAPNQVLGSPYLTRQIQLLGIQGWKEVTLLAAIPSDHQIRQTNIFTDSRWVTTSSRDGFVTVRKGDKLRTLIVSIMPHHRKDLGAVKAIMKPSGDVILSLGKDGSLVCSKFINDTEVSVSGLDDSYPTDFAVSAKEYERRVPPFKDDHTTLDPSVIKALTQPQVHLQSSDETWVDWKRSQKIAQEAREYASTRAAIQSSFAAVKAAVFQLMNANETCPEVEKLPLSAFDLDKISRDHKLKAAKDAREDVRCELEWNCAGMDHVSDWIKKFCWDKQQVQGQSLYTIFGQFRVGNYPKIAADPSEVSSLTWAQFSKQFVDDVAGTDGTFYPWMTKSTNLVTEQQPTIMRRETTLSMIDEKQRIDAILDEDEEETVVDTAALENHRKLEGMTTYKFIERSQSYYSQFELYGYAQMMIERQMIADDVSQLQTYFNKLFNDMHAIKERELSLVLERNERIRHIDSELNLLFNQRVPEIPIDPEWSQSEIPECIVEVLESEVKVAPYISPSTQDMLDKQAAEADRLRLLLLADDFRERALMMMMDGVLEVRWEDLIKKDVPKPQCMLTKTAESYTAEDILAVQQYEKDVEALMHEREKYRRILEADYLKINGARGDAIERFKQRLEDFFLTRVRVESAIQQLRLRYWRGFYRNMRRQQMYESEEKLKSKISQKEADIVSLGEELHRHQSAIADLRGHYEAACNREKWQEKKFRSEFPGMAKATHDLLMRQYKRRPRMMQKSVPPTYLAEMGKAAANMTKPSFLTGECIEYLKGLDALDLRPTTLPSFIDAAHWDHLIRLRRHKIESEFRVKSISADITDAEHTIMEFNKFIANTTTEIELLNDKLKVERQTRLHFDQDIEVQFVLKMGQIEVDLRNRPDLTNAIFIPRSAVEHINWLIAITGVTKIKTMERTIHFGRGINFKEWEHRMLKMRIEDLREELYSVERIAVSKEIQDYLKRKAKGLKDDKTQQQLEKELELLRKNWEKQLMDWVHKLEEVRIKIKAIRKKNSLLDKRITMINVGRSEMELQKDVAAEAKAVEYYRKKIDVVVERSHLVRKLQDNYSELMVLQTEYELLRLRRFPAFKFFKTLDDDSSNWNG